jgi:hypothetical protein
MKGIRVPAGSGVKVFTAEERPDLWDKARTLFQDVWPEYNNHGIHTGKYFGSLFPQHSHLQVLVQDEATERVIARGRTIPFRWDGSLDDLPEGIDAVGLRSVAEVARPTTLSALAAEVATDQQGRGLSPLVLQAMVVAARHARLHALVAPVRPNHKDRYPITPIEKYAAWTRSDGLPFDPWMRVHARLGATILRCAPRSMRITGSIAEWERWTAMTFPTDGRYVFPAGLAPLVVRQGRGRYWEPNVWMLHAV